MVTRLLLDQAGLKAGQADSGAVTLIQRFGLAANLNIQLHCLVETRTSSPLRITRGAERQSLNVAGLYPAGEGAAYAGGIMSAAVDGIEVAEALAARLLGLAAA